MKIAFFSNCYLPYQSGITISISTLANELRNLGHRVYIVGPSYPDHQETDPDVFRLPSLPATYPGYRLVIPYAPAAFSKLKAEKIDLIHTHQPFGVGLAALIFSRNINVPLVYTFHTLFPRYVHHAPFLPQRPAKAAIAAYLSFFCGQTQAIIVPSEMVRRYVYLMKTQARVEVVPTGIRLEEIQIIDSGKLKVEIRRKHNLPAEAKLLLYCGRLSEEKNITFLLKAFDLIRPRINNVFLVLVGGGPQAEEYKKLAGERVIFAGEKKHSEVLNYYQAADLFVYASVTETQGLVLAEAKACGLPAVAVFGGGIADVVRNGIDGYIVPQNIDKFVEHVLRILRDEDLRIKMSHQAREDAQERFSSRGVAKKIESIYNSLLKR